MTLEQATAILADMKAGRKVSFDTWLDAVLIHDAAHPVTGYRLTEDESDYEQVTWARGQEEIRIQQREDR